MAGIKLVPEVTKINFLGLRKVALVISVCLILFSIGLLITRGLNFGIDFEGGILMEVETSQPADLSDMRRRMNDLNLGDFSLQEFGASNIVLVRLQSQEGGEAEQQQAIEAVRSVMPADAQYRRVEFVGPTVGNELITAGVEAVVFSLLAILIYVWFRFEWQFGVGAVVALTHDVILTLGFFSFLQMDFNLSTVAAILTIAGYSINDTVIVYDRVREEIRKYKKMELKDVLNLAINKTLSRTILTSLTTLIALFSLYFLGGEVIAGFSLAMIFGIVVGTYSSIFVASPLLLATKLNRQGISEATPSES